MGRHSEITVEGGSANVYADLGYADGQFRGVSEAKLLAPVAKLGRDVRILVGPVRRRAGKIELVFA